MQHVKNLNSSSDTCRSANNGYDALKTRLRWRIRRARWMRAEQARFQASFLRIRQILIEDPRLTA